MLQTSLLLMKSLNKTETPNFLICGVFFVSKDNLLDVYTFKSHLNSNLNAVPKSFIDGKRLGQIYHARLRMRCSSLMHIYFLKVLSTVLCAFVEHFFFFFFEDTQHFLMYTIHNIATRTC